MKTSVKGKPRTLRPGARRPARKSSLPVERIARWLLVAGLLALLVLGAIAVWRLLFKGGSSDSEEGPEGRKVELLVTGYCNCEKCCSWTNIQGQAVYTYGKMKGKPKIVGQTSSGRQAHPGTIAADPKVFALGTKIFVPGYGYGTVEDKGGAIKDMHIDLWFPTHQEALRWGKRTVTVTVLED